MILVVVSIYSSTPYYEKGEDSRLANFQSYSNKSTTLNVLREVTKLYVRL